MSVAVSTGSAETGILQLSFAGLEIIEDHVAQCKHKIYPNDGQNNDIRHFLLCHAP